MESCDLHGVASGELFFNLRRCDMKLRLTQDFKLFQKILEKLRLSLSIFLARAEKKKDFT